MRNSILIILTIFLATSCGSLGEKVSGVTKQRISEEKLKGMNPVEAKKVLGTPVYEGFFGGNKNSPLYFNHKGFFYALVYSTSEEARYSYNLNDKKTCHVLLFFKNNQFKFNFDTDAKSQVADYCSPGKLNSYMSITEMDAQKFWDKYGY